MAWILEEEKEGPAGEPARARIFLKLAVVGWVFFFILWNSGLNILKMFGGLSLLLAIFASARAIFHGAFLLLGRGTLQVAVALLSVAIPFVFLWPHDVDFTFKVLDTWFRRAASYREFWIIVGGFLFIVYKAASFGKALVPVRRYLIVCAVAFFIAVASRRSDTGQALIFLTLTVLGYGAVFLSDLKRRQRTLALS